MPPLLYFWQSVTPALTIVPKLVAAAPGNIPAGPPSAPMVPASYGAMYFNQSY